LTATSYAVALDSGCAAVKKAERNGSRWQLTVAPAASVQVQVPATSAPVSRTVTLGFQVPFATTSSGK
jgi:hypothetical protein